MRIILFLVFIFSSFLALNISADQFDEQTSSKIIQEAGFLSLFRRSKGRDINASCGSLANSKAMLNE